MIQVTKQQHYVWQKYLSNWTNSNQIWTYFILQKKICKTTTENVAQKRYFYGLEEFSESDIKSIMGLIKNFKSPGIREISKGILETCSSIKMDNLVDNAMNIDDRIKKVEDFRRQIIENYHNDIENKGEAVLKINSFNDFNKYRKEKGISDLLLYVYTQYWRTEKMKKLFSIEESFKKHWNIICIMLAHQCVWNTVNDECLKFKFINNDTKIKYLTTDQPVINLVADILAEGGSAKDLELYYPLSPRTAIIIHFNSSQNEKVKEIIATKEYVEKINSKMIENANSFIFSENPEQLKLLVSTGI